MLYMENRCLYWEPYKVEKVLCVQNVKFFNVKSGGT